MESTARVSYTREKWDKEFKEAGFAYGPRMTLVQSVHAAKGKMPGGPPAPAIAVVNMDIPLEVQLETIQLGYFLHPGVIDVASQGIAANPSEVSISSSLPVACREIYIDKDLHGTRFQDGLWAFVDNIMNKGSEEEGDVYVYTAQGHLVAGLFGFTCKIMTNTKAPGQNGAPKQQVPPPTTKESLYFLGLRRDNEATDGALVANAQGAHSSHEDHLPKRQVVIVVVPEVTDLPHAEKVIQVLGSEHGIQASATAVVAYGDAQSMTPLLEGGIKAVMDKVTTMPQYGEEDPSPLHVNIVALPFVHLDFKPEYDSKAIADVASTYNELEHSSEWLLSFVQAIYLIYDRLGSVHKRLAAEGSQLKMDLAFVTNGIMSPSCEVPTVASLAQNLLLGYMRVCVNENNAVFMRIVDVQHFFRTPLDQVGELLSLPFIYIWILLTLTLQ